jgi:hypothetical protein
MTSDKKVQANRENGWRGKGPTSPEGKAWSGRNGLKSGLFSKDLVVAAAGEKREDYDALLSGAQGHVPLFLILVRAVFSFQSAVFRRILFDAIRPGVGCHPPGCQFYVASELRYFIK